MFSELGLPVGHFARGGQGGGDRLSRTHGSNQAQTGFSEKGRFSSFALLKSLGAIFRHGLI